jgi:hypothetical protein
METTLLPTVTLFGCCECCVPGHTMKHAEPCGKHQRAEAAAAKKAKRTRRTVETVETTEAL